MVTEQFVIESIGAASVLPLDKFLIKKKQPPYTEEYFCGLNEVAAPDWYKNSDHWAFIVNQWFKGVPTDYYWALLGTLPIGLHVSI